MKLLTFIMALSFLFFTVEMKGQFNTGFTFEANLSTITNDFENIVELQGRLKSKSGFGISAYFIDEFSDKFSIQYGVGYLYKRYETAGDELRWPSQFDSFSGEYLPWKSPVDGMILNDHLGVHDFHYISLPVSLSYEVISFGNKGITLRPGIRATYLVSTWVSFKTENNGWGENQNLETNNSNIELNFAIGVDLYKTEKMAISFIPRIGAELLSSSKIIDNHRLVTYSAGLEFRF